MQLTSERLNFITLYTRVLSVSTKMLLTVRSKWKCPVLEHINCPVLVHYHNLPNEHHFGRLWGSMRCCSKLTSVQKLWATLVPYDTLQKRKRQLSQSCSCPAAFSHGLELASFFFLSTFSYRQSLSSYYTAIGSSFMSTCPSVSYFASRRGPCLIDSVPSV